MWEAIAAKAISALSFLAKYQPNRSAITAEAELGQAPHACFRTSAREVVLAMGGAPALIKYRP
jgi:hypothetical protein